RKPDRVPKDAWWTPHTLEQFRKHTGADDPSDHYGFEHRLVRWARTRVQYDFSSYFPEGLPPGTTVNEWGEANTPGGFYHYSIHRQPLASLRTARELAGFPWPDVKEDYRHAHLEAEVQSLHDRGLFAIGDLGHMGWEKACYMRGILNISADILDNQDFATCLLEKLCDLFCFMARRYAEAGVDMVMLSEDVGMQNQLMISPAMYRKWVKPRTKRVIDAARQVNPSVWIGLHCCGYVEPLIRDLIEVGVNALHPIQPESMDPLLVKQRYGGSLTLWGTVGAQSVMPFGTPEDVRRTVRENITSLGYNGGLWIAPSQALTPEVPWDNIAAFFDAVEEFGAL
ncbi:MAG: uroporphyrinogen decarboxylase family protein, partial [Anaerolineae bacterium]|nr:uroporphyrinogen decarboxylase family protein [Anaerolineae bacterium]